MSPRDPRTRAVIFDLDGVLVDSEPLHVAAWKVLFARHGITATEEEFEHGIGMRDAEWIRYLFARRGRDVDADWWQRAKRDVFRGILERDVRPMPGAVALIHRLYKDFRLAVASNSWRENIETVLAALGVRACFDALAGQDDVRRPKPDPDVFLAAAAGMGLGPAACTVIDDSPLGIEAAKAAGMGCIGVATTLPAERLTRADIVLPSLEESEAILRFLGQDS